MLLNEYNQTQTSYLVYLNQYPPGNFIINGDFSDPSLQNNTYTNYIANTSINVPGWAFTGNALISNNSNVLSTVVPYPKSSQAVCLQMTGTISQTISLTPGTYHLSWIAIGRPCCDGSNESNPVNVLLNGIVVYQFQPPVDKWTEYSTPLVVIDQRSSSITFEGTWTAGDRTTLIQDIRLRYTGLKTIPQSALLGGSPIRSEQSADLKTCVASCSSLSSCTGATYNKPQQLCSLYSGKGGIVSHSADPENVAILSENMYYVNRLKELTHQLVLLNREIQSVQTNDIGLYNDLYKELGASSSILHKNYAHLEKERTKLDAMIREFENLDAEENQVNLYITNHYSMFLFFLLLAAVFICLLAFIFYKGFEEGLDVSKKTISSMMEYPAS